MQKIDRSDLAISKVAGGCCKTTCHTHKPHDNPCDKPTDPCEPKDPCQPADPCANP